MKAEISKLKTHEALMYNTLYRFRIKFSKDNENQKHHLYDIDDPKAVKEFTEEDLNHDELDQDLELKVKSAPRKVSMYE